MEVQEKTIKPEASYTMDNRTTEVPSFIPYDFIQRWETPAEKRARESVSWYPGVEGWISMSKIKEEMEPSNNQHLDISKANMEEFAGMCYDVDDAIWAKCYALEGSGKIESNDLHLSRKRDAQRGQTISEDQAVKLIAHASNASGQITIQGCKADHNDPAITKCEESKDSLSGFYIGKGYFLTSAHFRSCVQTETAMKAKDKNRASVITTREPSGTFGSKVVHLVHCDKKYDYAIFRISGKDMPEQSIAVEELQCVDELNFDLDLKNRRVFTIGYNTDHLEENFPDAFRAAVADVEKSLSKILDGRVPKFEKVFKPGRKTFCLGRLLDQTETPVRDVNLWKHCVTGWHGISGAMIACVDNSNNTDPRILILGIFKGGHLGNSNRMVPFKTDIYKEIRRIVDNGGSD